MKRILKPSALIVTLLLTQTIYASIPVSSLLVPGRSGGAAQITFNGKSDDTYKGSVGCLDGYNIHFYDGANGLLANAVDMSGSGSYLSFDRTGHGVSGPWQINSTSLATIAANQAITLSDISYITITFAFDPFSATDSKGACSGGGADAAGDNNHYMVICSLSDCNGATSNTLEIQ